MPILFSAEEFAIVKRYLVLYNCALKTILNKFDILSEDYRNFHKNNPIEHIKSRIKSAESIAEKLSKKRLEITAENARLHLNDIAGVRIICSFSRDIYQIVDILKNQPDLQVLDEKDYIEAPKQSGYRSYHIILRVPVYLTNKAEFMPVEVQIRTAAMDFWASLEHKVRYKYKEHIPKHLSDELVLCADKIYDLDKRMFLVHDIISLINAD